MGWGADKILDYADRPSFAYAASKHAVAGITKNFANELGKYHIQVNGITDPVHGTGRFRRAFAGGSHDG